ncbi:N-acetylmuramoyl-L-alanine amidase [Pelagibacterium lentulum]|uniref:N-acetylmuramoyl-L-alanine amidase n=1 Tax=Pelagibacterium lentulum TaxID=2029865 RepID=A0A916RJU6_9HYPH|nr:N-acetylmuramoyl-L-alanine amidase [Pelagibacterium lentulum]GGA60046.1 N-acetylmuramoyl-L-alanine amidase [Pelagibacterium lentulum]
MAMIRTRLASIFGVLLVGFVVVLALVLAPSAQESDSVEPADGSDAVPVVLDARVTTTQERGRLVIDLSMPTEFGAFTVTGPDRVIVELRGELDPDADEFGALAGEGMVSSYSLAPSVVGRVRAEMVLAAPAQIQQSYVLEPFEDQPARLVIDLIPDSAANFAANARTLPGEASEAAAAQPDSLPQLDGQEMAPGETATADTTTRPLVVIDPGHGGVDSGARSASGLEEKNIVLAFGLKLQRLLVETGRFDVALTRDTDVFLRLDERVSLARANQADLFISLHADSFDQQDVRGASVYTRGDLATDALDRALAENENRVDLIAGFSPPDEPAVVDVLVDLLSRETRRKSFLAAKALVEQLEPSIQLRPFPQRQADFVVLNSPDVPSVLIELGFLSNSDDTANLTTDAWLDRVAAALARGVAVYFEEQGFLESDER